MKSRRRRMNSRGNIYTMITRVLNEYKYVS
jgi:hypothetical protein